MSNFGSLTIEILPLHNFTAFPSSLLCNGRVYRNSYKLRYSGFKAYFCDETPSKTTVTHQRRKVSPLHPDLPHVAPIEDDEHGDHHL